MLDGILLAVHVLGAVLWAGALIGLSRRLARHAAIPGTADDATLERRIYRMVGLPGLFLLLFTGVWMLHQAPALLREPIVVAKLAAVLLLFAADFLVMRGIGRLSGPAAADAGRTGLYRGLQWGTVGLVAVAAVLLQVRPAAAQGLVKPRILVIFDTSTSMTRAPQVPDGACEFRCPEPPPGLVTICDGDPAPNGCADGVKCRSDRRCDISTYGDGSVDYPGLDLDGNGQADDSRIFIVKEALEAAILANGEIEFGLMRFFQEEGPDIRSSCQTSAGFDDSPCIPSGYDRPPFAPFEGAINYDGIGDRRPGPSCGQGGELLVPIAAANQADILGWIDHREASPYDAGGDRELRADGETPLAAALDDARAYLAPLIEADPQRDCRPYIVLLLTDGEESCGGNPFAAAEALNALTTNGEPTPVRTYVVAFGQEVAGSGALDQLARRGGTETAVFANDRAGVGVALSRIIQEAIPQEACNGEDDDCDGRVDEGLVRACETSCGGGSEVCEDGAWGDCDAPQPRPEACNGIDDDCDGRIDRDEAGQTVTEICMTACGMGVSECVAGALVRCSAPEPTLEVCNGVDDDCDGATDEMLTIACATRCGAGERVCADGVFGACSAREPAVEACNGADDDCDGAVDEGVFQACETPCGAGRQVCVDGAFGPCDAAAERPETCNGEDDDCDGSTDEGVARPCESQCGPGVEQCVAGAWQACDAAVPVPEVCDGADNDCDDRTDEVALPCQTGCGAGVQRCVDGALGPCDAGEPASEMCDGDDNDCDGAADENADVACESACGAGLRRCVAGALSECNARAPRPERCDGADDDCDGSVDEGLVRACRNACGEGEQICGDGAWGACVGGEAVPETCNDLDDDCDGATDEGTDVACETACGPGRFRCVAGVLSDACDAPPPTDEICDGLDNDCDGAADEAIGAEPCETVCGEGTRRCVDGASVCDAPQPAGETCDGTDEDCDGAVDEGVTRSCFTACGRGTEVCADGAYGACDAPEPADEVCDGVDDDCDGFVDEGLTRPCDGPCGAGLLRCIDGELLPCTAAEPTDEVCNGLDDDCDGALDEGDDCGDGATCALGQCALPCQNNECTDDLLCIDGFCVRDPCEGVRCFDDQVCAFGECVDRACLAVRCDEGTVCSNGVCVAPDCYLEGCDAGESCIAGACEPDPCLGVACGEAAFCRRGDCVAVCVDVECDAGERCVDGACRVDPCDGIACDDGEVCVGGACEADPCDGVRCPAGRVCRDGGCVADPCLDVVCPDGVCRAGDCVSEEAGSTPDAGPPAPSLDAGPERDGGNDAGPSAEVDVGTPTGGADAESSGCSCAAADGGGSGPAWFAILLLMSRRTIRRTRRGRRPPAGARRR